MERRTRILPACNKGLALLLALFILALAALGFYLRWASKCRFTPEKWNASEWNDRQLLIRDFLRRYDLYEMTREDIIALLGEESGFYKDYSIRYKTEDNLVYDFGLKKGSISQNITLVISFRPDGKVSSYVLTTYDT